MLLKVRCAGKPTERKPVAGTRMAQSIDCSIANDCHTSSLIVCQYIYHISEITEERTIPVDPNI